jgi:transcriptional regulator with XRE-family HTH domain
MTWSLESEATGHGPTGWPAVTKGFAVIVIGGALTLGGGTGASACEEASLRRASRTGWTTSGVSAAPRHHDVGRAGEWPVSGVKIGAGGSPGADTARLVLRLRNTSGLTWEQLASIFGVDRRSMHFWASGRAMNAPNAERLARVLAFVARTDRGDPATTRTWLLTPSHDGRIPLDLLREDRLAEIEVGSLPPATPVRRAPGISDKAAAQRVPRPPSELLSAKDEPLEGPPGKLIRSTRLTPRKPT